MTTVAKIALVALVAAGTRAVAADDEPRNAEALTRGWARTRSAVARPAVERSTTATRGLVRQWIAPSQNGTGGTRGIEGGAARGIKVEPSPVPGQEQVTVAVDAGSAVAFRNILFERDSAELADDASGRQVAEIAAAMKNLPHERFLVEGHTCDLGSDEHNKALSERRAVQICHRLVRAGVEPGQLMMLGFGESDPAVPNTGEENRRQNRRVVVYRRH